ncbi:uncharacterized protein LOC117652042 [Thrips palmi]|uniref:Uncharacterized protein LOC117652042 n=1 Tax=Thrips palmi TaxID=161013 RepID=A0A6P9A3Y0_THRPL|nr:uncharacterized protein LOC117652042 [Thrips palmi]
MSSSSETEWDEDKSDKSVCAGHDTEWTCPREDLDRVNEELSACQSALERYRRYVKHLQWHCAAYRKAIVKLPAGSEALSEILSSFERKTVCLECEKDNLIEEIASCKREIGYLKNHKPNDMPSPIRSGMKSNLADEQISPVLRASKWHKK